MIGGSAVFKDLFSKENGTKAAAALSQVINVGWLILLYVLLGLIVILSFSAYQLQFSIQSAQTEGNKPLTLWVVLDSYDQWKRTNNRIAGENDVILAKQKLLSNLNVELQDARASRIEKNVACARSIMNFHQRYASEALVFVERKYECDIKYFNLVRSTARKQMPNYTSDAAIGKAEQEVSQSVDAFAAATGLELSVNEKIEVLSNEIAGSGNQIKDLTKQLSALLAFKVDAENEAVGDFFNSLSYLENMSNVRLLGIGVPDFSKMPPDMLTLILVLAMGALGGTIHLTRIYFYGLSDSSAAAVVTGPAYYVFRPFLGAITALSIYIVVKSGVLVISVPSPNGEGARISPYFISFLGIVSGLLAEQALDTIQSAGNRWFANSSIAGPARWASRLAVHFGYPPAAGAELADENKKKLNDIAGVLKVSVAEFEEWLKEAKAVPFQYQHMIAAFLNTPERDLFTDIPPARTTD